MTFWLRFYLIVRNIVKGQLEFSNMKVKIIFLLISIVFLIVFSAFARVWTSKKGNSLEAEFVKVKGPYVILKTPDDKLKRIPLKALSQEDQDYVREKTGENSSEDTEVEAPEKKEVTEKEFMRVMKQSCVRCHRKPCKSVKNLIKFRWLKPGNPEKSPTYTIIGKHRRKNGKYHNLSEEDKNIVYEFIRTYK